MSTRTNEILQFPLIEGQFAGALCGPRRIGPHDVDRIALELPHQERIARKKQFLKDMASTDSGGRHPILRDDGKRIGRVVS
jgi:hypothetical protein